MIACQGQNQKDIEPVVDRLGGKISMRRPDKAGGALYQRHISRIKTSRKASRPSDLLG